MVAYSSKTSQAHMTSNGPLDSDYTFIICSFENHFKDQKVRIPPEDE